MCLCSHVSQCANFLVCCLKGSTVNVVLNVAVSSLPEIGFSEVIVGVKLGEVMIVTPV